MIAKPILKEVNDRLSFLENVGLDYLTLSRASGTLSGGEAQRIRLATQIGSNLSGVLYILDEPSIGLHQRDNDRLIGSLKKMRDLGNTLVVVEHDEDTMWAADYLIDVGPGAGEQGGQIVAAGTPEEVANDENSLTGKYLSGKKSIPVPKERRKGNGKAIKITGASENNLKNISVEFPLGEFVAVTGVSGSGKSTLVNSILKKSLAQKLNKNSAKPVNSRQFPATKVSKRSSTSIKAQSDGRREVIQRLIQVSLMISVGYLLKQTRQKCGDIRKVVLVST